jgi:hypothetical protein
MRLSGLAAAVLAVALLGAGCGDEPTDEPTPDSSAETTDSPDEGESTEAADVTEPIAVTFEDGEVTPSGTRIEVSAGDPVVFEITADEPGEIHVHSTPEQEFEYAKGTGTYEITIESPGVVDVESHDLDTVIVQLEVR